jgi:predicted outer membrane repeat protein
LVWLQSNAQSDTQYTFNVNANETIPPTNLFFTGKSNIGITLIGTGGERTISLSSDGSMFTVGADTAPGARVGITLTLGNNVTLLGRSANNAALITIYNNTLVMDTGSKITGNTNTTRDGGGVALYSGTFTMNGGEISGNTARWVGGGVFSYEGNFIMHGGKISGNTAASGGGVDCMGGIFTMNSGEITGNTATNGSGGGVSCLGDGAIMRNGKISGNTAAYNGGGVYSSGDFVMQNGEISLNTAQQHGGGVFLPRVAYARITFTMYNGTIFGNTASPASTSYYGGGVYLADDVNFRIANGTIYGSNETTASLRNTAPSGAALYVNSGVAQHGTFNNYGVWVSNSNLSTTNNTIRVVNGALQ